MAVEAQFSERLKVSLERHAALTAIEGNEVRLTYRELNRVSAELVRMLRAAGVNSGDIVPLLLRRSPALVVAQVALIRMGAAYAPIDRTSPPHRQRSMLDEIGPTVVLTDSDTTVEDRPNCLMIDVETRVHALLRDAGGQSRAELDVWQPAHAETLAYVMFTSGTTGAPKGVMVPHSGIRRLVCDANFAEFRDGARWGYLSSPAFDASTLEVWAPLLNGGCCVVQELAYPSIDDLAEFLTERRISDAWLTSSLFSAMVDDRIDAFAHVQQLLAGGERVSPKHARMLLETYPRTRLVNGYGPTENTTFTLCHTVTLRDTASANGIPIGKPIRGTTVRIVPTDTQGEGAATTHLAAASEGELLAAGEGVALGYLNDVALTERKFLHVDGTRWYRTGDVVREREDGVIEFMGRVDRQVKLQGNRIELSEIERVLNSSPGVARSALLVVGESVELRHLVAAYTAGATPTSPAQLVALLREQLPPSAVPARIVAVDRIPLGTTGKVDEAALLALIDSTEADEEAREQHRAAVTATRVGVENALSAFAGSPPKLLVDATAPPESISETEAQLTAIWRQYLPNARIGRDTNFLAIGGTSLLALQVSAQVRRKLGKNLTPIDVLRLPVLFEQARGIDMADAFELDVKSDAGELEMPLTATQRSMLAGMQLDDSASAYLVHVAMRIEQSDRAVDMSAVKHAFVQLAARHPALRMTILADGDASRARVRPALSARWWGEHPPLTEVPSDLQWPDVLLRVVNRPLNIARDGVMRVDVWPVANGTTLLVWTLHHVAIDEASIDRALLELDALLSRTPLQPVYGSPLGFAAFEKAWTDRDAAREWPKRLVGALSGTPPPFARAPGIGAEFALAVPDDVSAQLMSACARWGVTPFAPLLAAFGRAVQQVFGVEHRFVSVPFSRRVEAELIEPLGCLLDLNFVEAGVRSTESAADALARIQQSVLGLQRLTFFPLRAVADAVAALDPEVERHLNGFGFTWRIDPHREVSLGVQRAQLLRVQQEGARFGVVLHAWLNGATLRCSMEALRSVVDDGRAAAVGEAFVNQVRELSGVTELGASANGESQPIDNFDASSPERGKMLRRVWAQWVGTPAEAITGASNFLQSGGNSLTAMRMMTQLRRDHGLRIGVGEFLARPTFRNLSGLANDHSVRGPEYSVMLGKRDAPSVIVMLPGDMGSTLGLYSLASELQAAMGEQCAVVIIDLETMLRRAPDVGTLAFLQARIDSVVGELGWSRIVAVAGSSSGGVLALRLAAQSPVLRKVPVWLLDTYAPQGAGQTLLRRLVRPVARRLLRVPVVARLFGTYVRMGDAQRAVAPTDALALRRNAVHDEMFGDWDEQAGDAVYLVQSKQTVRDEALFRRRNTNGFNRRKFKQWTTHKVDGNHDDFIQRNAATIVEWMRASVRRFLAGAE